MTLSERAAILNRINNLWHALISSLAGAFLYRFSAPQCIKYTIQRKEVVGVWSAR